MSSTCSDLKGLSTLEQYLEAPPRTRLQAQYRNVFLCVCVYVLINSHSQMGGFRLEVGFLLLFTQKKVLHGKKLEPLKIEK